MTNEELNGIDGRGLQELVGEPYSHLSDEAMREIVLGWLAEDARYEAQYDEHMRMVASGEFVEPEGVEPCELF